MISIVVGVSLVPSIISSITEAKNTSGMPTGLSGLLDVLSYVFVAVILLGAVALGECPISAFTEQSVSKTGRIRGSLNLLRHGNPELSGGLRQCSVLLNV